MINPCQEGRRSYGLPSLAVWPAEKLISNVPVRNTLIHSFRLSADPDARLVLAVALSLPMLGRISLSCPS